MKAELKEVLKRSPEILESKKEKESKSESREEPLAVQLSAISTELNTILVRNIGQRMTDELATGILNKLLFQLESVARSKQNA